MRTSESDLEAIELALDSGAVTSADPEERRLQELALALRAEAPQAKAELEARLEERVARGFPRERKRRNRVPWRPLVTEFGVAAVLVGAIAAAAFLGGNGQDDDAGGGGGAARESAPERAPSDKGTRTAPAPDQRGIAPGEERRRIERTASLTLAAPAERLDSLADEIVALVDRRDGFVLRSSISTGEEGTTGGTFDLRVPRRELRGTLRDLSELADVRARTQRGEDITRGFVSVQDRLDAARALRRSLLRRLERATTDNEAEAIRDRLNLVSAEVRGLASQLRDLRERTDYAAVTVRLEDKDGNGGAGPGMGTGDAFRDAGESLVASFNIAVRVLGVLVPLALVGGFAWLAFAGVRRRRREAALI